MTLITGHRGFIGSLLAKRFPGAIGIDLQDGKDLLTCDLPETDLIYHLAAQSSVEGSWADPVHDSDNFKMTVRLAHRYPKAKIVYASSAAALGPIVSPYGFSKKISGDYLSQFHGKTVTCVFPNIYGRGSRSVVDLFKGSRQVTVYGNGLHVRDYVHVDDIVEGLLKAKDWPPGRYLMGSGVPTSVLQLAEGREIEYAPSRNEIAESYMPNTTPDWKPTTNVFDYLHA